MSALLDLNKATLAKATSQPKHEDNTSTLLAKAAQAAIAMNLKFLLEPAIVFSNSSVPKTSAHGLPPRIPNHPEEKGKDDLRQWRQRQLRQRAMASAAKKEVQAKETQRLQAMRTKTKKVSPLLVQRRAELEAKAIRKKEQRAAKREKLHQKRMLQEERERQSMQAEEWIQQRALWYHNLPQDGSWKTVRVFISSTFNDMHGERDVLTRNVFPALN